MAENIVAYCATENMSGDRCYFVTMGDARQWCKDQMDKCNIIEGFDLEFNIMIIKVSSSAELVAELNDAIDFMS